MKGPHPSRKCRRLTCALFDALGEFCQVDLFLDGNLNGAAAGLRRCRGRWVEPRAWPRALTLVSPR
jgi:hypothetical protein